VPLNFAISVLVVLYIIVSSGLVDV